MYLLDTDTFSEYLREEQRGEKETPIANRIIRTEPGSIFLCVVTLSEMMRGMLNLLQLLEKSGKDAAGFDELLRLYRSWQRFPIIAFDAQAQSLFDRFSPAVRRVGRPDCQIAAIAIANGFTVITANTRHFAQIPGVAHEDWTRPSGQRG